MPKIRNNAEVRAKIPSQEKRDFKKRCIDHNTTEADVIRDAVREFMRTHIAKGEKWGTEL